MSAITFSNIFCWPLDCVCTTVFSIIKMVLDFFYLYYFICLSYGYLNFPWNLMPTLSLLSNYTYTCSLCDNHWSDKIWRWQSLLRWHWPEKCLKKLSRGSARASEMSTADYATWWMYVYVTSLRSRTRKIHITYKYQAQRCQKKIQSYY